RTHHGGLLDRGGDGVLHVLHDARVLLDADLSGDGSAAGERYRVAFTLGEVLHSGAGWHPGVPVGRVAWPAVLVARSHADGRHFGGVGTESGDVHPFIGPHDGP